jgi:CxxC motif-containing protein
MDEMVKVICVTCPRGCTLEARKDGETVVEVLGGGCKRGKEYVKGELTDPRRMLATTVRISGALHPLLPVYTASPFPKKRLGELARALRSVEVVSPVTAGQVVLANVLGSGIDILASRSM